MTTKKDKKSTAVTKPKNTELVNISFGVGDDYSSGINANDVKIPLILLIHNQSDFPEWEQLAKADRPQAGDFYNPVTQQVFREKFNALIIHQFVQVYTTKQVDGRDVIDRFSSDGIHWNDGGAVIQPSEFNWKDGDVLDGSVARKRYNYVIIPEGEIEPCVIRFQKTSAKNARKMNFPLRRMKPMWSHFTLFQSVEEISKRKEKYLTIAGQVQFHKPLQDQELANGCKIIYDSYKTANIEVIENVNDDDDEMPKYDKSDDVSQNKETQDYLNKDN